MSTQSDRLNLIQHNTASLRNTLLAIEPSAAYTDGDKSDGAAKAARDIVLLGHDFDRALSGYIAGVEANFGKLTPPFHAEIKRCFAGLMSDVVARAFSDLSTRLGEEVEYRAPYAAEYLNNQTQGVRTGRAA
ncbi:hypothetical protein [Kaistia terrae]|uniref:Uncharacterized protein n=1 Tax=Kaistia terrae TaxID=537017 RepID=A0ABW0Q8H4_9HYPH|nr:hypothetical protein [Kaistia terrae]MCX5581451.1 hypothetical protein [Kaistia terrae]